MKQLVAIYDIGQIRHRFINVMWSNCQTISFWDRRQAEEMFYIWLVANLESMYFIIPDPFTRGFIDYGKLQQLDARIVELSDLLYTTVRVPAFSGDYRCHVKIINDDLFLIFN
jgi:hypothetical protein